MAFWATTEKEETKTSLSTDSNAVLLEGGEGVFIQNSEQERLGIPHIPLDGWVVKDYVWGKNHILRHVLFFFIAW